MAYRKAVVLMAGVVFWLGIAAGANACSLGLKPETSGFFLNPILDKVIVAKVVPEPGKGCALMVNDEILQLNDQVIPGQRASKVMAYWKSLAKDAPRVFKVMRAGSVVSVTVR